VQNSMVDLSVLKGKRLRAYVRINLSKSSELESQKTGIESTVRRAENTIRHWYEDPDRKRSDYQKSKVLPQVLADAEAGL
jgi:hypothetical protein